jgi:hypothetical protein
MLVNQIEGRNIQYTSPHLHHLHHTTHVVAIAQQPEREGHSSTSPSPIVHSSSTQLQLVSQQVDADTARVQVHEHGGLGLLWLLGFQRRRDNRSRTTSRESGRNHMKQVESDRKRRSPHPPWVLG